MTEPSSTPEELAEARRLRKNAQQREYVRRNAETIKVKRLAYAEANREKLREKQREYVAANLDKVRESDRRRRHANREERNRRQRERNQAMPDVIRDRRLKSAYGITLAEYERMYSLGGGSCWICRSPGGQRRLAVDHCHATGLVRGLLCSGCNTGIGSLRDDVEVMQRAIAYVQAGQRGEPFLEQQEAA